MMRMASPAVLCAWLLLAPGLAGAVVYQHFAYYDESEMPGWAAPMSSGDVYGVFFYPTLDASPVFTIERMRFWHLESNAEPDPYRILLVVRNTAAEHIFEIETSEIYTTTCTGCWEEVLIERSFWDSSSESWSFGVLMQPQDGNAVGSEPIIRTDDSPSVLLHNLWAAYNEWSGFGNISYLENWNGSFGGNYFMEIIVRYDEPTAVLSTSLSAVKALY